MCLTSEVATRAVLSASGDLEILWVAYVKWTVPGHLGRRSMSPYSVVAVAP